MSNDGLQAWQDLLQRARDVANSLPFVERMAQRTADKYLDQEGSAYSALIKGFYPPSPNGRPLDRRYTWPDGSTGHKFPSPKSQAYFFAHVLPRGLTPYKRTFNLQNAVEGSIEDITPKGYALRYTVNLRKAPYAPFVIGGDQYYYHRKTGWVQLAQSLRAALEDQGRFDTLAQPVAGYLAGYITGSAE